MNRAWLTLNSARPATTGRGHRRREGELLAINRDLAASVLEKSRVPGQVCQLSADPAAARPTRLLLPARPCPAPGLGRLVHRAVGTFVGLFVVALVVVLNPSPWWVVAIILVCLIGQDVLVPFNYFLALILVTPMSLLAIEATGHGDPPQGSSRTGCLACSLEWPSP